MRSASVNSVAASAEASLVRESSCHLVIGDMHAGDSIDGYLD